jgi:hypothetical protein
MKKTLVLMLLLSFAFFISCSSGGGGSSSGGGGGSTGTPGISNLSPQTITGALNQGGGAMTVSIEFDFVDSEGDLTTCQTFAQNPDGSAILRPPIQIQGVSGVTTGRIRITAVVPTTQAEIRTWGVYVKDAKGQESNRLFGTLKIN